MNTLNHAKIESVNKATQKQPQWKIMTVSGLLFLLTLTCGNAFLNSVSQPLEETVKAEQVIQTNKNKTEYQNLDLDECYIVQQGNTLFSISKDLGYTVEELSKHNNIEDPSLIYPGQRICPLTIDISDETSYQDQSPLLPNAVYDWIDNGKISQWSSLYGVPEEVIASLILTESGGDKDKVSDICSPDYGCDYGLFQLNETFFPMDNPYDADENARLALNYFVEGFNKSGSLEGAYAYYNGGPSTLNGWNSDVSQNVNKFSQNLATIMEMDMF